MKTIIKKLLATFLTLVLLCSTCITAFASTDPISTTTSVSPRLSHLTDATFAFSATSDGGYAQVFYFGDDSFARANITIKLEKKFLLVFWNDVDEWNATSTSVEDYFFHTFTLDGKGTYRATFTFTVTGKDNTVDTITDEIQSKLS